LRLRLLQALGGLDNAPRSVLESGRVKRNPHHYDFAVAAVRNG